MKQWEEELKTEIMSLMSPFLVSQPNEHGEARAHCPFHDDEHPSFNINFVKGVYICHACGVKGNFVNLYNKLTGGDFFAERTKQRSHEPRTYSAEELITIVWTSELLKNEQFLEYLRVVRALPREVVSEYKLGLACINDVYYLSIPIPDENGEIHNAKLRKLTKTEDGLVFATIAGKYSWFPRSTEHFRPIIYPADRELRETVFLCTGELDALVLRGRGFCAVSSTRGENFVPLSILEKFTGKTVYLCPDNDEVGRRWAESTAIKLREFTESIYIIALPNDVKDVSDFFAKYSLNDFKELRLQAEKMTDPRFLIDLYDGIFVEGTSYCVIQKKRAIPLTSFVFKPKKVIKPLSAEDEYIASIVGDLITPSSVISNISLPLQFLMSPREMNEWLLAYATDAKVFTASTSILEKLKLLWSQQAREVVSAVSKMGLVFDGAMWVFVTPNKVYPTTTQVIFHDPINKPLYSIEVKWGDEDEITDEFRRWVYAVLRIQPTEVVIPIMSYFHACLLAPYIRTKVTAFPVMLVLGIAGSGKTASVCHLFAPMIGLQNASMLAVRRTTASLRITAHQSLSFPLILDEFTPERYGDDLTKTAQELIHYCYNAHSVSLAEDVRKLAGRWSYTAPLVLIGEYFGSLGRAIEDRIFRVVFPFTVDMLGEEHQSAFQFALEKVKLYAPLYAGLLMQWLVRHQEHWDEWWAEAADIANKTKEKMRRSFRQNITTQVLAFGFIILRKFLHHLGLQQIDQDIFTTATEEGEQEGLLSWHNWHKAIVFVPVQQPETVLENTLMVIDEIVPTLTYIHDYIDIPSNLPPGFIALNISKLYPHVVKYLGRSAPSLMTLRRELRREEAFYTRGGYVYAALRRLRFGGERKYMTIIDLPRFEERVGMKLINIRQYLAIPELKDDDIRVSFPQNIDLDEGGDENVQQSQTFKDEELPLI